MNKGCSLEGKTAIVTGGRRGIGKAIALAFGEVGADVAVVSQTDDDRLAEVAREIKKMGRRSIVVAADVSKKSDVDNMVQKAIKEFGRIDVLVNGAGMWFPGQSLIDCTEANWDRVVAVNLKGTYLCCQAVGKKMMAQKSGCIVNIASRAGVFPRPKGGAYASAKAGIIALTKQLSLELAEHKIRVNAIAPGWVKTDINIHLRTTPENEQQIAQTIVSGRMGEPEDIAYLAVFLASDAATYINGQVIIPDGGGDRPAVVYKPK